MGLALDQTEVIFRILIELFLSDLRPQFVPVGESFGLIRVVVLRIPRVNSRAIGIWVMLVIFGRDRIRPGFFSAAPRSGPALSSNNFLLQQLVSVLERIRFSELKVDRLDRILECLVRLLN